jgi:uncharacterized protein YbjT (DUF2867 family)
VDGDWNDPAAIERAPKGVEGAFVMLPAIWAPSPDYKEAKGVIANYVEALTKAAPPRVVALSSMGANRTSGLGMITALSLLEQGFRPVENRSCAAREPLILTDMLASKVAINQSWVARRFARFDVKAGCARLSRNLLAARSSRVHGRFIYGRLKFDDRARGHRIARPQ